MVSSFCFRFGLEQYLWINCGLELKPILKLEQRLWIPPLYFV